MVEIGSYGTPNSGLPGAPRGGIPPRKHLVPVGIFFLLFLIESVMAVGAAGAYFLYAGAGRITEIESDTRSHAATLAEALGSAAELSYRAKSYARLRDLFHEKMEERTFDEAFFVLKSGKLIAHSDPAVEERLGGSIAAGGTAYDLDLLLQPVAQKSTGVLFTDYNIASKPVPFDRGQRDLIRQYLYRNIDTGAWLARRAVYGKKKPVGVIAIIISKAKIHKFIRRHVDRTLQVLRFSLAAAFTVSLIVSLIVFARYRNIRKRALAERRSETPGAGDELYDMTVAAGPADGYDRAIDVELGDLTEEPASVAVLAAGGIGPGRRIKDAVPAEDKE